MFTAENLEKEAKLDLSATRPRIVVSCIIRTLRHGMKITGNDRENKRSKGRYRMIMYQLHAALIPLQFVLCYQSATADIFRRCAFVALSSAVFVDLSVVCLNLHVQSVFG